MRAYEIARSSTRPPVGIPENTLDRDTNQLSARAHARLAKQLLQCRFDRRLGDADRGGDLLVGQPFEHAAKDATLARGQRRRRVGSRRLMAMQAPIDP